MSFFFINMDMHDLIDLTDELPSVVDAAIKEACNYLAVATKHHIIDEVNEKLHSRRAKYLEHLHLIEESETTFLIVLDQEAMWIEEGMESHEMIENLLGKGGPGVKTAKDGSKYRSIPFSHSGLPSQNTPAQQTLQDTIKRELRRAENILTGKKGIPYKKIETGASGKPLLGRLHSLNINTPLKTHHGPGQGWGPVGGVRQGPTGIPFLKGVQIYQSKFIDKKGEEKVRRDILTFRTVSTKHSGTERWVHPGLEAQKFFDDAADWAERERREKVVPMILDYIASRTGG
jgi:hypothetical protein